MASERQVEYRHDGYCPICESDAEFVATTAWYRESLHCTSCGSIPRERALALVLNRRFPDWRDLAIHESSPARRGISVKLERECKRYVASHYFPGHEAGGTVRRFRNENLEAQTFDDAAFDLVVTLDVMEHVNDPKRVMREIARTLRPGGAHLFTTPTYLGRKETMRRARYRQDGSVEHLAEPEYHGNPICEEGALVTFHYGYNLPSLIHKWSGTDVDVARFLDHRHGIIGEFTEVYIASNRATADST